MSFNVRIASKSCQPGGETVEPQPSLSIETHETTVNYGPPGARPAFGHSAVGSADLVSRFGSQAEINALRRHARGVEQLLALHDKPACAKCVEPLRVWLDVPAPTRAVEAVSRR